MEKSFWAKKWSEKKIGFHEPEVNNLLIKHFKTLSLAKGSRIFLPLCGKTLDISWLLSKGYKVVGVELMESAIDELFKELRIKPKITKTGRLKHYSAHNIDLFVGDIFDLTLNKLGNVDAIYDRAAMVALPETMRSNYASHLLKLTRKAPQLLISYEYDQNLTAGPPFSVNSYEINHHYSATYDLKLLESKFLPSGFNEKSSTHECVWLLQ